MKKIIVVGLAILAVSTSGALAKGKAKPKEVAAAPAPTNPLLSNVSAADKALYMKNKHDSGMK